MRVLTDFHHSSLLESLILLFERRLGYELYRQIGLEWFSEGFWKINNQEDTARQFLELGSTPSDGTRPLNDPTNPLVIDGCKVITLDAFKNSRFDILIASLPQHIEPFKKLIELYQPGAKLIYQIGNQWQVSAKDVKNVMASAKVVIPDSVNGVTYHQEFDINIFHYEAPQRNRKIYSFINCLSTADLFSSDWALFLQLERMMPEWEFKSFGGQCRDGNMQGAQALADKMREADFIFHCKTGGDGYGHIIHNAASVGRMLITREKDNFDKLAQPLVQQSNSIVVDGKTPSQIMDEITKSFEDPALFELNSSQMHKVFERNCNFDRESERIKKFLDQLK